MDATDGIPQTEPSRPIGGAIAYLNIDGVMKAIEFYKAAFGAEVAAVHAPDDKGRTLHAHLHINGASVMLSDFFPEHGFPVVAPAGFSVLLPVGDVDTVYQRAIDAGATATMPPADMFWGDRYAALKDPFGVAWAMNGPPKG